ncbi:MAG: D-alanyl-D-alanine carboxypeptidase/D-alanyl-D-alanine-endopeptidase [Gemmatimonadetes bacterium]|nr:D-alanyl-D-alanine carboxypeptidase/D-alanyl-D-alanine-endopeptidase [Gemmatimonadota bacterium]
MPSKRGDVSRYSELLVTAFVAASLGPLAPAGTEGQSLPGNRFPLQGEILRFIRAPGWRASQWGVLAVSLENGDTLVALEPDLPMAPASNQKLFTTAAALDGLGAAFRFPTYLLTDGAVVDGVLQGDLVLYGTGDPGLSDRFFKSPTDPFRDFARELSAAGVQTVSGDVIGDGSFFQGPSRRPSWGGLDNWYAAPVSALTFNENVVTLRIHPGVEGQPTQLLTIPDGAGLRVVNTSRTVAERTGPRLIVVRDDPDDPIEIRGEMRVGQGDIWRVITVSDPAQYAAAVFRQVLAEEGIQVLGGVRSLSAGESSRVTGVQIVAPALRNAPARPLHTVAIHYSPPLGELLGVMNRASHNLFAELFLFTLGRVETGEGSFEGGSRAVTDYLVRAVGARPGDLRIDDGSGLSKLNRTTPATFIRLFTHVAESSYADEFWSTVPQAGNPIELRRMYRTPAAGNLRAKTGTISRVSALSGVVRTADGEAVLFSIVSNNIPYTNTAKRIEDQIAVRLASFSREEPLEPRVALVEYGEYGPRILTQTSGAQAIGPEGTAARR